VRRRVDAAVQRGDAARAQPLAQRVEGAAAGVAEHEVEGAEPLGRQVGDRLARVEPAQVTGVSRS
jgi:hypothetical protein